MKTIKTNNLEDVKKLVSLLELPATDSHKGQNGKALIVGGSGLFHAPLIWAAEIASKIVDMVHVSSPNLINNQIMEQRLKEKFWNGIVVPWENIDEYVEEDEVVLIGPGMMREEETELIVNTLLRKYPNKKWVVDGGALQEVDSSLLNGNMMITPHQKEWERLLAKGKIQISSNKVQIEQVKEFSKSNSNLTVLLKGSTDTIVRGDEVLCVEGGNPGMAKGGTGDVLAGLAAALATKNDLFLAAQVASIVNKRAGDELYKRVGVYFNASDLVQEIPIILK